jgi:hypothetical protein
MLFVLFICVRLWKDKEIWHDKRNTLKQLST